MTTTPPVHITTLTHQHARAALAHLARFHYRQGPPARPSRTLAAINEHGEPVGVLCVSFPTLNGPWRAGAWPDRFARATTNRARAALLNTTLRTITRVIIDPRYRGMGLSVRLVRAYLSSPETPLTEAVASMARFCPLFEAAGMRRIESPPSRRDTRLARVLLGLRIAPASLMHLPEARAALRTRPTLARAVLAWARDSRSTRRYAPAHAAPPATLAMLAAQGACRDRQIVFVSP